jgi:hypothetical protein
MPGHVIVAGHGHVCEQPAKLRGISHDLRCLALGAQVTAAA